jgi:hypothetical protein
MTLNVPRFFVRLLLTLCGRSDLWSRFAGGLFVDTSKFEVLGWHAVKETSQGPPCDAACGRCRKRSDDAACLVSCPRRRAHPRRTREPVLEARTIITPRHDHSQLTAGMTTAAVSKQKTTIIRISAEAVPAQAFVDLVNGARLYQL